LIGSEHKFTSSKQTTSALENNWNTGKGRKQVRHQSAGASLDFHPQQSHYYYHIKWTFTSDDAKNQGLVYCIKYFVLIKTTSNNKIIMY